MITRLGDSPAKNKAPGHRAHALELTPQMPPTLTNVTRTTASSLSETILNVEAATCQQSRFHTVTSRQVRLWQVCSISWGGAVS